VPPPVIQADSRLLAAAAIDPTAAVAPLTPPSTPGTVPTTVPSPVPTTVPSNLSESVPTTMPTTVAAEVPAGAGGSTSVATPSATIALTVPDDQVPPRPVRVLVVGDSTSLYVGQGLAAWSVQHPDAMQVDVEWCQGCSFVLDAAVTTFDVPHLLDDSSDVVERRTPEAIRALHPDVVVLMVTMMDVADREWDAGEGPLTPFDPRYVQRETQAYGDLTMHLLGDGVPHVVWVVPPTPYHLWLEPAMNEAGRYAVQHDVIRDVVEQFDTRVGLVDLDAWLSRAGHDHDPWWRNDGVHLTEQSASALAELFLGPELVNRALAS
jgi:hypothetical protein